MGITIEQVEKLKERANVTYEEARAALEKADGDLLEAMILLEREGKATRGTGYYSTNEALPAQPERQADGAGGGYGNGGAGNNGNGSGNGGGYYGNNGQHGNGGSGGHYQGAPNPQGSSFGELMSRLWQFIVKLFHISSTNHFEVYKEGRSLLNVPVIILILVLVVAFPITLTLLIVGLFCGCRYRFSGSELGRDDINDAMDTAADTAESMKQTVHDSAHNNTPNDPS